MKSTWIPAIIVSSAVALLSGCDASTTATSSTPSSSLVSGRTTVDSAGLQVTDANGDTVTTTTVTNGSFQFKVPAGTRFPLLVLVDSSGNVLRTFVPDSSHHTLTIDSLADSVTGNFLRKGRGGLDVRNGAWSRALDSLRAGKHDSLHTDSLGLPKMRGVPDSIRTILDSLKWTKDSLRAACSDSVKRTTDSLLIKVCPPAGMVRPPRFSDSTLVNPRKGRGDSTVVAPKHRKRSVPAVVDSTTST